MPMPMAIHQKKRENICDTKSTIMPSEQMFRTMHNGIKKKGLDFSRERIM